MIATKMVFPVKASAIRSCYPVKPDRVRFSSNHGRAFYLCSGQYPVPDFPISVSVDFQRIIFVLVYSEFGTAQYLYVSFDSPLGAPVLIREIVDRTLAVRGKLPDDTEQSRNSLFEHYPSSLSCFCCSSSSSILAGERYS